VCLAGRRRYTCRLPRFKEERKSAAGSHSNKILVVLSYAANLLLGIRASHIEHVNLCSEDYYVVG